MGMGVKHQLEGSECTVTAINGSLSLSYSGNLMYVLKFFDVSKKSSDPSRAKRPVKLGDFPSVLQPDSQAWLVGPQVWLTDSQAWLAG